ncbi:MAG: helix-turn-helix transcriptional regulator [Actinobacteria bacterium]|nr:helix-turn-helix transcriptional regulator [Actinomycetota bacterium]
MEPKGLSPDRAIYIISVAAEIADVHPQTLRIYERKGLLTPKRTQGNTRRYSERDIERLRRIQELTQEGVNLAGVARIFELESELEELRAHYQRARDELDAVLAQPHGTTDQRDHNTLVLFKDVRRIRRAMKTEAVERAAQTRFALPPVVIR